MADYVVGLDLGQVQDYTAICVVTPTEEYKEAERERLRYDERLSYAKTEERPELPDRILQVRHLERIPLGTRYPDVVACVQQLINTPPLKDNSSLVVDATGVGVAVTDMLRDTGLTFKAVTITSGDKESRDGSNYRVPKRNLISAAQVLFQQRRLKIAASLPEAQTLLAELRDFKYKITAASNLTYESWREGSRDDLVLALSLAVWEASRQGPVPSADMAVGAPFYSITDEELYNFTDEDLYNVWP